MTPATEVLINHKTALDSYPIVPPSHVREQTVAPARPAGQRFVYLDAMKGIMILWGIPVHASVVSDSEFFDTLAEVSGWVRMEAFFIISGFLTYMLIKRYGGKAIMLRRLIAIGIPLASVLLLVNPVTNFLALKFHNGTAAPGCIEFITGHVPSGLKGTWNWHLHVWFLIVLLCLATVSTQMMDLTDQILRRARTTLKTLPDEFLLFLLSGTVAIGAISARVIYEAGVKPYSPDSLHFPLRAIGYYSSFFGLGLAMFASPRLLRIITGFHWAQLCGTGLLYLGARLSQPHLPDRIGEVFRLTAEVYMAVMLATVLFAFFKKFFSTETKMTKFIAESAFAVYLFHYLVIYLNAFWLRTFVANDLTLSLLVTITTTVVAMSLYEFVIRRSGVLRCLFLGKIPKRAG